MELCSESAYRNFRLSISGCRFTFVICDDQGWRKNYPCCRPCSKPRLPCSTRSFYADIRSVWRYRGSSSPHFANPRAMLAKLRRAACWGLLPVSDDMALLGTQAAKVIGDRLAMAACSQRRQPHAHPRTGRCLAKVLRKFPTWLRKNQCNILLPRQRKHVSACHRSAYCQYEDLMWPISITPLRVVDDAACCVKTCVGLGRDLSPLSHHWAKDEQEIS